jgi:serine-type D-Ala-D-Ala carboxypeptidase/endopeptidase (penicillin-binding protein 4)
MALLLHPHAVWTTGVSTNPRRLERSMQKLRILVLAILACAPSTATAQDAVAPSVPRSPAGGSDARVTTAAVSTLRTDLERLIQAPGWGQDRWSVLVVSLSSGDTLFRHDPDATLAPASNMKLFTTAAALYYLGPEFRYNTFLLTDGTVTNGALSGDIVLYGTGDPTLSDRYGGKLTVLEAFADSLLALGVQEVRGDVVGDGTYFDGAGYGEGWSDSYMDASYAAPSAALSLAENLVTLQIRPGAQAGWRPEVRAIPGGDGLGIVNQATTVAGGRTSIRVSRAAYDGPIVVRGQIGRGGGAVLRTVPSSDPPRYAAAAFREVLEKKGIRVTGEVRSVLRAAESAVTGRTVFAPGFSQEAPLRVLAIHTSPPLLEILDVINKKSHNLFAEQVLRTVGRVALGTGSAAAGARAVQAMLGAELGDAPADLQIYDGSGLSTLNRVSARSMIDLLSMMSRSSMWESYWSTLPEAGVSSGLRRMQRTDAERNLRAKTGTINHVSALSGYVQARNREVLAFSIISNEVPSTWRAKRVEDAIGARLASFDRPHTVTLAAEPSAEPADSAAAASAEPAPPATTTPAPTPSTTRPAAAPATSGAAEHEIRAGDTLDGIARSYGVTVQQLQAANPGLNPRRLIPGRTIALPGGTQTSTAASRSESAAAAPQQAAAAPRAHTIRAGDTMDAIAKRYGTTVAALQAANPGLNPRRLIPGRTLKLPN